MPPLLPRAARGVYLPRERPDTREIRARERRHRPVLAACGCRMSANGAFDEWAGYRVSSRCSFKPAGAVCNLDCRYCYYLKTQRAYPPGESFRMPDSLLEEYTAQHIAAAPGRSSASPGTAGAHRARADYFRRVRRAPAQAPAPGWRIANGVQTTVCSSTRSGGESWRPSASGIGLSLDARGSCTTVPRDRGQRPSTSRQNVPSGSCRRYRIPCDILCVVARSERPAALGRLPVFQGIGGRYVAFLPVVRNARAHG